MGSIVTTQAEPIQIYLKVPFDLFQSDGISQPFVEHYTRNHYGIGDCKLDVKEITQLDRDQATEIINTIHKITLTSINITAKEAAAKNSIENSDTNLCIGT